MNRSLTLLGALLAAQLILALLLSRGAGDFGATAAGEPLLHFDRAAVDRITISGGGAEVKLVKKEGKWQLPDHAGLPANGVKVEGVLDQLTKLEKRHPVATSPEAVSRFKVADDNFERKVVLSGGEKALAQLYLGDSPGYRRSYLRAEGDGAVYEGELGSYELSGAVKDWGDPALLHLDADAVESVEMAEFKLLRQEQKWSLGDLAEGESLDQGEAEQLVRRLANLGYLEVAEGSEGKSDAELGLDAPAVRVTLKLKGGESRDYAFGRKGSEGDYLLRSSAHPWLLKVADFTVDPLKAATREKLVKKADTPVTETPAAQPEGTATDATPPAETPPEATPATSQEPPATTPPMGGE